MLIPSKTEPVTAVFGVSSAVAVTRVAEDIWMSDKSMTIATVRDRLCSWYGGSEACLDVRTCEELGTMIEALDEHIKKSWVPLDMFGRVSVVCPTCKGSKAKWCRKCANSGQVSMAPTIAKGKES